MGRVNDWTIIALAGFAAGVGAVPAHERCPYPLNTRSARAWLVGAWLYASGQTLPRQVRMSVGCLVRANGMLVSVEDPANLARVEGRKNPAPGPGTELLGRRSTQGGRAEAELCSEKKQNA